MIEPILSCKNCGNRFQGKYCNKCGEKVYTEHDKSIPHFLEEALHFLTHFEGTFFTTIKTIFSRPGKLSLDYCNGLRKKYFKPLPLFMLLVVLYLVFPIFSGLNTPFQFYLNKGSIANAWVTKRTGTNVDSLIAEVNQHMEGKKFASPRRQLEYRYKYTDSLIRQVPSLHLLETNFTAKSGKISKISLLLLLPLTALVCWVLSIRRRRVFFDHLILSTEINSFYLLFGFFLVPVALGGLRKVFPGWSVGLSEVSIVVFTYSIFSIFSAIAFHIFYSDKWWWAITKALLLVVTHFIIVQVIYKFILFALTFYFST